MANLVFPQKKCLGGVDYEIDTDKSRLDLEVVHRFLHNAHWSKGIPLAVLARAIDHSLTLGVYRDGGQVGFARVVSDRAAFAYLADVFVLPAERGLGLGRWLVEAAMAHPKLMGMRRWLLATRDAHGLYRAWASMTQFHHSHFWNGTIPPSTNGQTLRSGGGGDWPTDLPRIKTPEMREEAA